MISPGCFRRLYIHYVGRSWTSYTILCWCRIVDLDYIPQILHFIRWSLYNIVQFLFFQSFFGWFETSFTRGGWPIRILWQHITCSSTTLRWFCSSPWPVWTKRWSGYSIKIPLQRLNISSQRFRRSISYDTNLFTQLMTLFVKTLECFSMRHLRFDID